MADVLLTTNVMEEEIPVNLTPAHSIYVDGPRLSQSIVHVIATENMSALVHSPMYIYRICNIVYVQVRQVMEVVKLSTFQSADGIIMEVPAIGVDHVTS